MMRLLEMRKLDKLSPEDLKEQAEAAKASNEAFSINVQSLLDENGIVCDDAFDDTLPNRRSKVSTLAKSGTARSIEAIRDSGGQHGTSCNCRNLDGCFCLVLQS